MKLVTNVDFQTTNKMEMYLTNVPPLTPKMIRILDFQGFTNLKIHPLQNGLYSVVYGKKNQRMDCVGFQTDNYNLLRIRILSMIDNLKENVWNEQEQCYMDTFQMVEKHIPSNSNIWKKWLTLKA
jgi:hypothetical protein